jgi:hypothetical protein
VKYDFAESMRRLKSEINQHYKGTKLVEQGFVLNATSSKVGSTASKTTEVQAWNSQKVKEWTGSKNLNPSVVDYIKTADGRVLFQIYVILPTLFIDF